MKPDNYLQEQKYIRAKKRIEDLKGYYWHLASYIVVNLFLSGAQVVDGISENKSFRDGGWHYSHLKTFRYKVYKKIKEKDFMIDNKFIKSATDHALMFPMLEMIGDKFKCIPKPMYIYNQDHSESNNKNFNKFLEQTQNANIIRNKPKYKRRPNSFQKNL